MVIITVLGKIPYKTWHQMCATKSSSNQGKILIIYQYLLIQITGF